MTSLRLSFVLFALLPACDLETSEPVVNATAERAPLGKADRAGSCETAETDFCGGQAESGCWCDDLCADFGDCCSDKPVVCDGEEPEACAGGHIETVDTFTDGSDGMQCVVPETHCVTDDHGACPQFSPPSPDFCRDGEVVAGPPSYIASADGMECRMPSVHCVTKDESACAQETCEDGTIVLTTTFVDGDDGFACTEQQEHCLTNDFSDCPQLSPLPPDFCEDGDVVAGAPSFISAAGGMECQMPSVHCVTRDSDACPQLSPVSPEFCKAGQIVAGEPSFIASADGKECRIPSLHCVALDDAAC